MRKNKKLWSYALAGALAVSNLSGVVAAPFTTIVAQAAIEAVTVKVNGKAVNTGGYVKWGDILNVSATSDNAEKEVKLYYKVGDAQNFNPLNSDTFPITKEYIGKTITFAAGEDAGDPDGDKVVTVNVPAYAAELDGKAWSAGNVTPGKSYSIRITEGTEDITSTTNISVTGPADLADSNKAITIKSTAIENQTVTVKYAPSGASDVITLADLTVKAASTEEIEATLTLSSESVELAKENAQENVLVGVQLPSGYKWKDGSPTYGAFVQSGNGIGVPTQDNSAKNKWTLTANKVTKKTSATVRYTVSGTAIDADKNEVAVTGQIDQTVTVYPTPAYKVTTTGDNQDKDDKTKFTLKEEEGSITLTASVDPDGTDIPELEGVQYVWAENADEISIKPDGASVVITPTSPFTVSDGVNVTLDVKDKTGANIKDKQGQDIAQQTYTVALTTESKPTIEATATEVTTNDAVKFTVKDAEGKVLTANYEIYDGSEKITVPETGYKFTKTGSHKITVKDTKRNLTSDPITIVVRTEDGIKATGLKLSKDSVEVAEGVHDDTVTVTVLPDGSVKPTDIAEINTVTVKSADPKVATAKVKTAPEANSTVSTLEITGVAPGETTVEITADDKNVKDKKVINVTVAGFKAIVIAPESGEVEVGKTLKLSADVQIYGKTASKDIVWHSSDESVATVKDGTVTGVAEGPVKIYATAKNDDSKKSNEVTITVADKTVENAVKAANDAADAAVANPTDATIKAAQDAVAAAKAAGAEEADLKAANEKIAKAEAAKKAADEAAKKKADEEAKKNEKAADGSAAGAPAAEGTELVDANGNKTGYKVTDASASNPEVEYEGPADKNATKADIPETYTDLSGNTYKVTGIVANAFKDTKVKTVTIRKNIKKIDPKAFNKSKVKNVKIKGIKLTKKMAKSFKKLKKGGWIKVSGKHKAKNKEILNNLSNVKNGKTKVK